MAFEGNVSGIEICKQLTYFTTTTRPRIHPPSSPSHSSLEDSAGNRWYQRFLLLSAVPSSFFDPNLCRSPGGSAPPPTPAPLSKKFATTTAGFAQNRRERNYGGWNGSIHADDDERHGATTAADLDLFLALPCLFTCRRCLSPHGGCRAGGGWGGEWHNAEPGRDNAHSAVPYSDCWLADADQLNWNGRFFCDSSFEYEAHKNCAQATGNTRRIITLELAIGCTSSSASSSCSRRRLFPSGCAQIESFVQTNWRQ